MGQQQSFLPWLPMAEYKSERIQIVEHPKVGGRAGGGGQLASEEYRKRNHQTSVPPEKEAG